MKPFTWVALGAAVAAVVYLIVNSPEANYSYAGGDPDVASAARKTGAWGSKQRVTGTGGSLMGKVKQGFGEATGNDRLANEGALDQAAGAVKDTVGQAAHAVSDTLHDLNR